MRYLLYGYGGGHYRRYTISTPSREELHEALDKAIDQGYDSFSITAEDKTGSTQLAR